MDGERLKSLEITVFLKLLIRTNTRLQMITADEVSFAVSHKDDASYTIFIEADTKAIAILYSRIQHGMLGWCDVETSTVSLYNSIPETKAKMEHAKTNILIALSKIDKGFGNPLFYKEWTIEEGRSGRQNSSDDCDKVILRAYRRSFWEYFKRHEKLLGDIQMVDMFMPKEIDKSTFVSHLPSYMQEDAMIWEPPSGVTDPRIVNILFYERVRKPARALGGR